MARLDVELERLADPAAWPNRCARCGVHGTQLVPAPAKYAKKQAGWRVPLCPAHADDWAQVARKNRIGAVVILVGMAVVAAVTWVVYPRFANQPDDLTRAGFAFLFGFLAVIPLAIVLAMWAKTPIRIEQVQGRFASIIGVGRSFKAVAAETVAPAPLPAVSDEARFDVSPYQPVPNAAPEAVGLLFAASVLLGGLLGFGVAVGGLELHEVTKGWPPNDWRYVGLVVAAVTAFALILFGVRFSVTRVGLFVLGGGVGLVGIAALVLKVFGFRADQQFAVLFTGLPLLLLVVAALRPIIWNQRIRHPVIAGVVSAFGPLVYTGVVFLVAGTAPGPQLYALGVGPLAALAVGMMNASTARMPYCQECDGWLTERRLGAVARPKAEMEPILADGGLISLSAAKTYQEKASVHDTELAAFTCPHCRENGTVVVQLSDCRATGKNESATLFTVGRWLYPGAAVPVIDAIFPPEGAVKAEDPTPRPPPRSGEGSMADNGAEFFPPRRDTTMLLNPLRNGEGGTRSVPGEVLLPDSRMSPPVNVAAHLVRMAGAFPDRPALHVPIGRVKHDGDTPHHTYTFAQLNADTDALAHRLEGIGIRRGTRVALMVPPGRDFFALTFALLKVAAIPVLIDPGMGVRNLGKCLGEAQPEAFVGVAKAHVARRLFGWAKKTVRVTVNVGRWRFFCTRSIRELREDARPYEMPDVTASDPAAILFTSGSTGVAKGVEYTHGIFAAQVEMLKDTYGIQTGEVDLCTFPLFALFGPALGMTGVVPDMDATRPAKMDPKKALAQIRQFGVTNLFGSPAVIRQLSSLVPLSPGGNGLGWNPSPLGERGRGEGESSEPNPNPPHPQPLSPRGEGGMRTLRRVISAGAPATPAVLERFVQLLTPGVQVFTPYGATEALPVSNIGSDEILTETRHLTDQGRGVCVGKPVNGMTVHVVPISDESIPTWDAAMCLPPGQVGEFVVRGPVVTKRYFHRDDATKLAKIHDPATGETLHRMGDVGYIDDRGRMWFAGRKSHRIETPHGTLFTDMVEPMFNAMEAVTTRTALVGVSRNGVTYPLLLIEEKFLTLNPDWGAEVHEAVAESKKRMPVPLRNITVSIYPGRFPVDVRHNSKIFREKLAAWADKQLGPDWTPEEPL